MYLLRFIFLTEPSDSNDSSVVFAQYKKRQLIFLCQVHLVLVYRDNTAVVFDNNIFLKRIFSKFVYAVEYDILDQMILN